MLKLNGGYVLINLLDCNEGTTKITDKQRIKQIMEALKSDKMLVVEFNSPKGRIQLVGGCYDSSESGFSYNNQYCSFDILNKAIQGFVLVDLIIQNDNDGFIDVIITSEEE